MRRDRIVGCLAVAGLLLASLSASSTWARDKDGKGDRSGSGGGRSSAGSGPSGSSSRNMSSGSGPSSSGMSRSSSGGDSSRGFSGRSSQSVQMPSVDRSSRSSGSGSGGPTFNTKSFSGPSTRGLDSGATGGRSSVTQRVARPVDGVVSGRDSGSGGPSFQGFPRGGNPGGGGSPSANGNNISRTFGNGGGNAPQFNQPTNNGPQLNRSSGGDGRGDSNPGNLNRDGSGNNTTNPSGVKRPVIGQGPQNNQGNTTGNVQLPGNGVGGGGRTDNRFGRPQTGQQVNQSGTIGTGQKVNREKVDEFLQLRRENSGKTLDSSGDRNGRGGSPGSGNLSNGGGGRSNSGQLGPQKSAEDQKKDADQAWAKRFGNGGGKSGGVLQGPNDGRGRDGKGDPRNGIVNVDGKKPGGRDWKFDKDFVDRNYKDWRKGSPDGKGGKGDYRDWSGQWKKGDRFASADYIRSSWKKNGKGKDMPFSKDWWDGNHRHGKHWNHWDHFGDRHYRPYHWWGWCSAPRLTTWVSFGWNDPCYWDYGPGEYIYCNNGVVYVNGAWFEPAPVFYQRTLVLAQQAPVWTPVQAAQVEWLPLGVFAIARDGVADNNVLVQLAVTRDGVIGGNIFNQLTGQSFPIQGTVDKQSQRAAWTYTDDTGAQIVMESSIFNLTQPAATGLIHYGPDSIQVMELVRLEDPGAGM